MSTKRRRTKPVEAEKSEAVEETTEAVETATETEEAPSTEEIATALDKTYFKPKEEPPLEPKVDLEKVILDVFNKTKGEAISIKYFMDKTGLSELDVALAWHSLYDQKKVPYPDLPRGF